MEASKDQPSGMSTTNVDINTTGSVVQATAMTINPVEILLEAPLDGPLLQSSGPLLKVSPPPSENADDPAEDDHDHELDDVDADADSDSDSLLEEYMEAHGQHPHMSEGGVDSCTPEESALLIRQLRELGPAAFIEKTIDAEAYTAKKLLTAFGIRPPAFLADQPDEAYYNLLSLAISRELSRRIKLLEYNTVQDAVELIKKSSNIIVLTGAGISTSLGIPDFRSKGTGLYSKLEYLGLDDPQDVFEINLFREDPTIFFSVAKDIIPDLNTYTPTHKFIAMLHQQDKLLTNYSQNIDNLEINAGVPPEKLIQCHGSFGTATCIKCGHKTKGDEIFPDIKAGKIPRCTKCVNTLRPAPTLKRKRSTDSHKSRKRNASFDSDDDDDDADDSIFEAGVMKPDITFFGEALPATFSDRLTQHDKDKVDLVIVIGTSLKVSPVSEVVNYLPANTPQIYISRTTISHMEFDIDLLGDCDVVVTELCKGLGWEFKHEMIPEGREVDISGEGHRWRFRVRGEETTEDMKE